MSRDVLTPPLMRMEPNRCYRVNLVHEDFIGQYGAETGAQRPNQGTCKSYAEEDLYGEEYNEELDDAVDSLIEETASGTFKLNMHVAPSFFGGIIGNKGSTKRRIESEARCDIIIPRRTAQQNNANCEIVIKAKTRNDLLSARRKIQLLLTSLRKRMKATHFFGIALNYGTVQEKFIDFKNQVLSADIAGINESLFQTEASIHLTFGVCTLLDDVDRTRAMEVLQSCREFLNDLKPPFSVHVSGLNIMNDDPSSVRVLYALVESVELEEFANRCFHRFIQSGLSFDDHGRGAVKLHMTVMNSKYSTSKVSRFDAREILKRWSNFDFGSVQCNELLLLCLRKDTMPDRNKFYKITDTLKFSV